MPTPDGTLLASDPPRPLYVFINYLGAFSHRVMSV
jgi:hypothetical protein